MKMSSSRLVSRRSLLWNNHFRIGMRCSTGVRACVCDAGWSRCRRDGRGPVFTLTVVVARWC